MRIGSPHWDEQNGVCTKHHIPQIPCPSCLAGTGDADLQIVLSETDRLMIDFGDSVADMVPANLAERVRNRDIEVF